MIYTVIGDYKKLLPEILSQEGGINSPFSVLPDRLKEYIREPKNEEVRQSRLGGYLLLFHTVRFLFGELNFEIDFTSEGKPYFTDEKTRHIVFNISHSGGLLAVSISDEAEQIGVDVQELIDKERAERMLKRFYKGELHLSSKSYPVYLFGGFSAFGDCMFAEIPPSSIKDADPNESFTDRWALCEALMKCDGRGFGAFAELEELSERISSETVRISYKGKIFSLATAIRK